jgi:imidazolonepropionase-like amidohydrolase
VKIALGSDIGEGDHTTEFRLMIAGGMAPIDALFAATRNAAELLGASGEVGSVQAGRRADIVAVKGDPLAEPALLGRVDFVMKEGRVYRVGGTPVAPLG